MTRLHIPAAWQLRIRSANGFIQQLTQRQFIALLVLLLTLSALLPPTARYTYKAYKKYHKAAQQAAEEKLLLPGRPVTRSNVRSLTHAGQGLTLLSQQEARECLGQALDDLGGMQMSTSLAQQRANYFVARLKIAGNIMRCPPEPGLSYTSVVGRKVLLAANFHNSEHMLPNFIYQTLRLGVSLDPGALHVSIYESGSNDHTPQLLEVLKKVLEAAGVTSSIVIGGMTRVEGMQRIDFLSAMRNAALSPVLNGTFAADHVAFVNDVYFCDSQVLRLLQYRADMSCGMDFNRVFWDPDVDTNTRVEWMIKHLQKVWWYPKPLAEWLAHKRKQYRKWEKKYRFHPSLHKMLPFWFYDTWVARDYEGRMLQRWAPYSASNLTSDRLAQGLPFPAYCCWNGLAILNPKPLTQGVRFRSHVHGECSASECSLICDDYWRLGYDKVIIDPAVRLMYRWDDAVQAYDPDFMQYPLVPWVPSLATQVDDLRQRRTPANNITCCDLLMGHDMVEFKWDCRPYDHLTVNYTDWALQGRPWGGQYLRP